MFREAVQQLLGDHLRCPKCHEMNVPKASPTIRLDATASRAECSNCSYEAPLERFQPKE